MLIDRLKNLCHIKVSIQNKSIKRDVEKLTLLKKNYYLKSGNVN